MKWIHTSLILLTGLFSHALFAQASPSEAPAAAPADTTVEQPADLVPLEQPASLNETAGITEAIPDQEEEEGPEATPLHPTGIPFDSSPYPIILEKMLFGVPPDLAALNAAAAGVDAAALAREQEKIAASFSWTAINITPDGKTAIGFTDLSAKPPASYYMTVGESANNWTVVDADYNNETATIEKDGVSISLKFGNKSPVAPTTPGTIPALKPGVSGRHSHGRSSSGSSSAGESRLSTFTLPAEVDRASSTSSRTALLTSYRERLNERLKAEAQKKNEADLKQKEELSKLVSVSISDALRKQQEEAAAAAAQQEAEQHVLQVEEQAQ